MLEYVGLREKASLNHFGFLLPNIIMNKNKFLIDVYWSQNKQEKSSESIITDLTISGITVASDLMIRQKRYVFY